MLYLSIKTLPVLQELRSQAYILRNHVYYKKDIKQLMNLEQFWFERILDWSFFNPLIVCPPVLVHMLVKPLVIGHHLQSVSIIINQDNQPPPPTSMFHPCHLAGNAFGNGVFSSMAFLFICIWKWLSLLCIPFMYLGTWYMMCLGWISSDPKMSI